MVAHIGEIVYLDGNYHNIRTRKKDGIFEVFTYFTRPKRRYVKAFAKSKDESLAINELIKLIK